MAFPTYTYAGKATSSDSASLSWDMPSGLASGLRLILIVFCDGQLVSISTPAGFSAMATSLDIGAGAGGGEGKIFYKTTDGSEGSGGSVSLSGGTEKGAIHAYLVTGADNATAPEASTSNSTDPASLTPSWGSADTLWLCACGTSGGASEDATGWTSPTGFTTDGSINAPAADSTGIQTRSTSRQETTASKDPAAFTISAGDVVRTILIGIKPAAAAAGTGPEVVAAAHAKARRRKSMMAM